MSYEKERSQMSATFIAFVSKYFILNNGKNNLGKLDPRSDEGIFMDFPISSRSYRLFNKRTLRVEESVHIVAVSFQKTIT